LTILGATGLSFVLCAILTPLVRRLAIRWGIVDRPDGVRKLHAQPIPLGGGVAIVAACLLTLGTLMVLPNTWQDELHHDWWYMLGLALAIGIICGVGLIDDRYNLRGRQKLAGQMLAILVMIGSGLVIQKFSIFDYTVDLGMLAIPFTIFWLLGAVNALNLIDGVDGLATSIGLVFSIALAAMAFATGHEFDALLAMTLGGALAGFLIYNFPPARIFLGDSGSMVIGLTLGVMAIRSSLKGPATVALAAPTAVWAVLIFDVSMAIVRRKLTGRSLYTTDRGHLHHSLLRKGLSGPRIVIWVGLLCAICGAGALASICYHNDLLAIVSAMTVISALVLTRFFGYSEVSLLVRSLRSFVGSFLRFPSRRQSDPEPICSRLQGDREWHLLWEPMTEYAEVHDLCMVQLNVNLPALHEEYHAVWKRKHGSEHDQMWHATLPLVANGQSIGRLRLAGLASSTAAMSDHLAALVAGLKPFEEELFAKAGLSRAPRIAAEVHAPHRPPADSAAAETAAALKLGIVGQTAGE
jgi:UDP-GlcNAc:undecaprenyl-phosphate/decaprenyl-phosphate GlcNAc-1-phosphate transferase